MKIIHKCSNGLEYIEVDPNNWPDMAGAVYWSSFKYATYDMWFGELIGNNHTRCYNCNEILP